MARLIDADLLLENNTWEWFDDWGNYTLAGQAIADAPTVDAAPVVHGEWNGTWFDSYADTFPVYDYWECSNCHEEYESVGDPPSYNYCPNCGAKMDGGDK